MAPTAPALGIYKATTGLFGLFASEPPDRIHSRVTGYPPLPHVRALLDRVLEIAWHALIRNKLQADLLIPSLRRRPTTA